MNVLAEFFAGADGLSTEPCAEEKLLMTCSLGLLSLLGSEWDQGVLPGACLGDQSSSMLLLPGLQEAKAVLRKSARAGG